MHTDNEHGLRVQLATALRERDDAQLRTEHWLGVTVKLRENLNATLLERDALRAEVKRLRTVLTEITDHGGANRGIWSQSQARAALASGGDRG